MSTDYSEIIKENKWCRPERSDPVPPADGQDGHESTVGLVFPIINSHGRLELMGDG